MDHYLRISFENPGLKLFDGMVPYMHYKGVPVAVLDAALTLATSFPTAKRDGYFIVPRDVTKEALDAWILSAKDRGYAGCLPQYRIIVLTQIDDADDDGKEYLVCGYDPCVENTSLGRFRTKDAWLTIREELSRWVAGVAREHGERGFRIPGEVLNQPMWYPPTV